MPKPKKVKHEEVNVEPMEEVKVVEVICSE